MSRARVMAARVRALFGRGRLERQLNDEVRFHLEMQAEDNETAGMSPAEARSAALRSFGAVEPMKESHRDRRAFAFLETLAQDVRFAVRTLRKSPGFTLTSILVLALAIGANTAMFSVVNAVLLRPLSLPSPEQLTMLWTTSPTQNIREARTAYQTVEEWRRQSGSFAGMAIFDPVSMTLTGSEAAERITVLRISADLFPLLGVRPLEGRLFSTDEAENRQRVALISERLWRSRFGGSREAIGAPIELDGMRSEVIGVIPAGLPIANADVLEPHTMFPDWEARRAARGPGPWFVLARLRPGVSLEQAQSEMTAIARRVDDQGRGVAVVSLHEQITGSRPRLALWMLSGAVFCVLLIAASNVASLWVARSARRAREIAIRTALGASRARIVRQFLVESVTLSAIAGLLGVFLAFVLIRFLVTVQPVNLARINEVSLDLRTLAWAAGLSLLTGMFAGLAPGSLKTGPRVTARRVLVAAEFALAIMLLTGAGLLVRSLWSVQNVALGFRPEGVLVAGLATSAYMPPAQRANFYARVVEQVGAIPGVDAAGIASEVFTNSGGDAIVTAEGGRASERMRLRRDEASEGFFSTLGAPLLRGRFFSAEDGANAPRVAIVNDAMARRLWPDGEAVGRRFKLGPVESGAPWFTVAGIVGDMRRQGLEAEPIPQMFVPLAQDPSRLVAVVVRTTLEDPLKLLDSLRAAASAVDPSVPVYGASTLESRVDQFLAERRFETQLLIGFSGAALLIAAVGIYGLIQYSVVSRTREIGIRMAVGAPAGRIFGMVIREGLRLSAAGIAIGLAGALAMGRAISSLLYGVGASDPATFAAVSITLLAVAAAACYFPARRAMKIQPLIALRHE